MPIKHLLKEWIIPPALFAVAKTVMHKTPLEARKKYLLPDSTANLESFKNKYEGKRCFILATGPSIQQQDLSVLKDEHCIAVSQFFLHEQLKEIKPIWHVLAPMHMPFKFDTARIIFENAFAKYKDFTDINFLLGNSEYQYSYLNYLVSQNNPFVTRFRDQTHFVNYNGAPTLTEENYKKEKIWQVQNNPFIVRTVIYEALQLAFFLGFKEIVLLGCDHDFNYEKTANRHFYADANSYSDKEHLNMFTREAFFLQYYTLWKEYRLMNEFLQSKGVKVINATEGGILDVFQRRKLEDLITDGNRSI